MTTTPLIPATAAGPAQEMPAPPTSAQADDSPTFRDVLASQSAPGQQTSAPKDGAKEPASSGKSPAGDTASADKPAQAGKKTSDKKSRGADELAAAAGSGLPGIALYIAAEATAALGHPAPGGGTETIDGNQEAGPARLARPGDISPGPASAPDSVADATASLARPAAAGAGTLASQLVQTGAAREALPDTAPEAPATRGASRPVPGHEKTPPMAAATAAAPAGAARTPPAGLPGADPDNNPPHAMLDLTRRTLVHPASESAPTLLAATPTASTTPSASTTTLTGAAPAISVPLQSPHWPGELGRQFVAIVQSSQPGQGHTAQLRLDPPNLGPLHIAIHISDNVAQAVFFSPHAQVRQAVENALPQLQQQLAQAGIALGQASVSDQGTPQQAFSDDASAPRRRASGSVAAVAMTADSPAKPQQVRTSTGNALVDTFA